jgi:2-polyprenyl-3-methyl-5-hydroxy-6-metoxy-1,4-benzoquinol methylase
MTIGKLFRKLLGPRYFKSAGKVYRSIFVDLKKVAQSFPEMKSGSHLLDIGGGDGELINYLKKLFPDIKIYMIDIANSIGISIDKKYIDEIMLLPSTSINKFYENHTAEVPEINFILISDVIHHIVPKDRKQFFFDLSRLIKQETVVVFKDIEPGYFISKLSYLADKYISGDKTVELTSKNEIIKLMKENFPEIYVYETNLIQKNHPNFLLVFSLKQISNI